MSADGNLISEEADVLEDVVEDEDEEDNIQAYFLQPANEYNIHDKIKEANHELFLEMATKSAVGQKEGVGRKVTFRPDLEEYDQGMEDDEEEVISLASNASSEEIIEEECEVTIEKERIEEIIDEVKALIVEDLIEAQGDGTEPEEVLVTEEESVKTPIDKLIKTEAPRSSIDKSKVKIPPKQRPKCSPAPPTAAIKYKSCCAQKKPDVKLPNYSGDVSEYGLSRDQVELMKERKEAQKRRRQERAFKKYQEQLEKSRLNDLAFAKWLREKLAKLPRNKYANRYEENLLGPLRKKKPHMK